MTTAGPSNSNGDVVAVGLSDPSIARNRKEMLELVNRLRDTGYVVHPSWSSFTEMNPRTFSVQTDIDLPMIAVIGNQSVGIYSIYGIYRLHKH